MNFKSILLALSFLFLLSTNLYSQEYNYIGTLSYLDGTPVKFYDSDIDKIDIIHIKSNTGYTRIKKMVNDTLFIDFMISGDYVINFMDIEVVRFSVSEVDSQLQSNLPGTLSLPFNYIATTKPNQTVKVYDDNVNLIESYQADENGYVPLRGNSNFFSNKFLVIEPENQFPQPTFFKEIKPTNKGKLSYRKLSFPSQILQAKKGLVHNFQDDIYYTLRKGSFNKDKDKQLWLLLKYEVGLQKGSIHKLDFSGYKKASPTHLFLDEAGKVIVVMKQRRNPTKYDYQSLIVSKNGNLQASDNIYVYPYYRFKDNFVEGTNWIIPTFRGIALPKGSHQFKISCNGTSIEPDSANEGRSKLIAEINKLVAEIEKAFAEGRDIGNSKSKELQSKRETLGEMPEEAPAKIRRGSESSSESFSVLFAPFGDRLWKMDSPLNTDNKTVDSIGYDVKCVEINPAWKQYELRVGRIENNDKLTAEEKRKALEGMTPPPYCLRSDSTIKYFYEVYTPSGYDPDSEISKLTIIDCILEVDGKGMDYSYKDPEAGKGIMYMDWDNEQDRADAMESAIKNATIYMGFPGEGSVWGKTLDIFEYGKWDITSTEPINSWEGPYPELRYGFKEILGEYASMKEARQHCKSPKYNNKTKTYNCYDHKIVTVCLDNYQYSVVDGQVKTNYEALYCGEKDPEPSNIKGNEIVVVVSADGYITETRALAKRDLEASDILLSGHITDKEGTPIEGAKIKLRGIDKITESDDLGIYNLITRSGGTEPHSETMNIKLQKIGIEISNEELGDYEGYHFGVVSDGFTTLKLKVKATGIRPQTVIVKQPELGSFVEQSMLKIPLVLNADGEGEMEYVPPPYLKKDQLTKRFQTKVNPNNQYGLLNQIWVAEVPIEITYEDEDGNPGSFTLNLMVSRPPVFSMHGFTGDETTWATLGNYLRVRKYETYAREYYQGPADESTIQRQSQKLGFYIQKIRESYKDNNILQTRIDIVAHSMGGLMSRYYINNMSKYGEKAGIVIPYDVKLSREQLAAARNQKPVKLIDVRKLIMVGTPNHGASKIDELFGVLGALSSDYHQLANSQLRSDSEFFKILNAGESEGRHLDPNVQYALLYGIRKRSGKYPPDRLFYPWQTSQKNFADDDGVVKISSAILNGILNIPFPKDWFAMTGYIHSPAPALTDWLMGEAITESTDIFDEVAILLQEDIKRTPLVNSYAEIIRANEEVYMRYFSTDAWEPLDTPIDYSSTLGLLDDWCQIKTGEGDASLGFFIDGHHWGLLHVQANTIIYYEYASPEFVKVYLQDGKARFRSRKQTGGGFEVIMGDEGEKWYTFNPKAKVRDLNTDFIVEEGDILNVYSINGKVAIGISEEKGESIIAKKISKKEGVSIDQKGKIKNNPLPDSGWWSNIDTSFVIDEVIEEEVFVGDIPQKSGLTIGKPEKVSSNKTKLSEISPVKFNKLPIVNFEIGTVSGGSFDAPVWIKFYPVGTYDPDGYIVLFEMDMDGDGTYDVQEKTLTGGSYEFTIPGKYIITVRVADDNGGITTKSKSFTINDPNATITELPKVYQQEERKQDEIEVDDKLDLIIKEYKRQDEISTTTTNEIDIVHQEPIKKEEKSPKPIPKSKKRAESDKKVDTIPVFKDNLLVNGSFEEPVIGSFKSFGVGQEIAGWKVVMAPIDLVGTYFKSSDGKQSLDLHGSPGFGAIEQTFRTEPQKRYKVTFDMAGNSAGEPMLKKIQVSAAGESEDFEFDCTGTTTQQMDWTTKTWEFAAINNSTTLTFATLHNTGNASAGPVIDNIKVVEIEAEVIQVTPAPKEIISDGSTIPLTADSYVYAYSYRNWNEANFGQSELLSVGWHSTGGEKRSYLKFDLPNISADDLIRAQLKLFVNNTVGKNKLIMGVYNILESWEEGFGTFHSGESEPIDSSGAIIWDYQPTFDDSVFAEFKLRKKRDKSIKVDITALVKSWLINNSNYGLLLKPQGYLSGRVPTSIYEIYSKEYQDQSKHPILILDIKE